MTTDATPNKPYPRAHSTTSSTTHSQLMPAAPLTSLEPVRTRGAGRPTKLVMPPLPEMEMTDIERNLFDYFLDAYHQEYPDLIATDHILLHLAALEYIKLLRMIAEELKSGQLVTMSRQSPAVNMRGLLDQLSVTRRARVANKKDANTEDERELRDFFMNMSKQKA